MIISLIGNGLEPAQFLDRSEEKPCICHLYNSNIEITLKYLLPEEYYKMVKEEDEILKNPIEITYKLKGDKTEYKNKLC